MRLLVIATLMGLDGLNLKWGEPFVRRSMHHLMRRVYDERRAPLVRVVRISRRQSADLEAVLAKNGGRSACGERNAPVASLVGGVRSSACILRRGDVGERDERILMRLARKHERTVSRVLGRPHALREDEPFFANRYEGEGAGFGWHYDNEPAGAVRLLLVVRQNSSATFDYVNAQRELVRLRQTTGDGVVLRGTTTFHSASALRRGESRWVVSFQYGSDAQRAHVSYCSRLSSGTTADVVWEICPNLLLVVGGALLARRFHAKAAQGRTPRRVAAMRWGVALMLARWRSTSSARLGWAVASVVVTLAPLLAICPEELLLYAAFVVATD